jgi:predicted RecA/RadA family phage recombinase
MAYTAKAVQRGNRVTYSNSGSAIGAKQVVVIVSGASGFLGISMDAIAATTGTGEVSIGGGDERVWNLPKKSGDVFTQGMAVYWDSGNGRLTTSSTGNTRAGRVVAAAASAATSADLILNQA